jgi:hypothetical protein
MLKRILLLVSSLLLVFAAVVGVQAQQEILADTPVTGEITNESFAQDYVYKGTAGEVLVITLAPVDILSDYDQPALLVTDESGRELINDDSFGTLTIALELEEDGIYTITATRYDGATGLSVGEYTLTLTKPQEMALGDTVEGRIDNESTQYYMYRGEDDFILVYNRDGSFAPQVSLITIGDNGILNEVGFMGGDLVTAAAIGIIPGETIYLIRLAPALFSFSFDTQVSDYTLEVTAPSDGTTPGEMRRNTPNTTFVAW